MLRGGEQTSVKEGHAWEGVAGCEREGENANQEKEQSERDKKYQEEQNSVKDRHE